MTILKNVLLEEKNRLEEKKEFYSQQLLTLPKGTIFVRKIHNSFFAYRKYKKNKRVISEYLGSLKQNTTIEEINRSKEYKRIKENLLVVEKEIQRLDKVLKNYE